MPSSASSSPTPRCPGAIVGRVVPERGPALAEDRVRGLRRVAAQRQPEPEQVAQRRRHDVGGRLLRRGAHDHAGGAAAGDEVAQQLGELALLLAVLAAEVERQLVARDQVQRQPVLARDLARARGPAARGSAPPSRRAARAAARSPRRRPGRRAAARTAPTPTARPACRRAATAARDGSSAAVATSTDSAALLPAPGSPPISTLRSGSVTVTVSPSSSTPTGIGSHSDSDSASRCGQATDTGPASGSRRTSVTVPVAALSGSRATRTSRACRHTASSSARCSTCSSDDPRDARTRTSSPAGIARHVPGAHTRQLAVRPRPPPRAGSTPPAATAQHPSRTRAAAPRPPRHAPAASSPITPASSTTASAAETIASSAGSATDPRPRRPAPAPARAPGTVRPPSAPSTRRSREPQLTLLRRVQHPDAHEPVERLQQRRQLPAASSRRRSARARRADHRSPSRPTHPRSSPRAVAAAAVRSAPRPSARSASSTSARQPTQPAASRRPRVDVRGRPSRRRLLGPRAAERIDLARNAIPLRPSISHACAVIPSTRTISPCLTAGSPGTATRMISASPSPERDELHPPQHLAVRRPRAAPTPRAACPPRTASAAPRR